MDTVNDPNAPAQPDASKPSLKKKDEPSSVSPHLTPSEIESLRKHGKLVSTSLRGKFADLFNK